jgi:Ca2+-binding RTX toxin-like protein
MVGGAGDDTYWVDHLLDQVVELRSQGDDTVNSLVTYTLPYNVENLNVSGLAPIHGSGNSVDNVLNGNAGDNRLAGGGGNDVLNGNAGSDTLSGGGGNDICEGGAGADRIEGGTGDDVYVIDDAGDTIDETSVLGGNDSVESRISYQLGPLVENLRLIGAAGLHGDGNSLDNTLSGNDAANRLSGLGGDDTLIGGAGNDTLTGGIGADTFKFVTPSQGPEDITDFTSGADEIQVVSMSFGSLTIGTLAYSSLKAAGADLTSVNPVFLYDAATGALSFDNNGKGAGGVSQIASLTGPKTLLASDIQVVVA